MVADVASGLTTKTRVWLLAVRFQYWIARTLLPKAYANDALICFNSYAFVDDPAFKRAYKRGARSLGNEDWYQWEWRVHVGLWAACQRQQAQG